MKPGAKIAIAAAAVAVPFLARSPTKLASLAAAALVRAYMHVNVCLHQHEHNTVTCSRTHAISALTLPRLRGNARPKAFDMLV